MTGYSGICAAVRLYAFGMAIHCQHGARLFTCMPPWQRRRPPLNVVNTRCGKKNGIYCRAAGEVNSTEKKKGGRYDRLGDPLGVRTQDPNIKSVVLYQLS